MNYREHFESLGGLLPVAGDEFVPLTEAELSRIEAAIGQPLPKDYREFLGEFGGVGFGEILLAKPVALLPGSVSTSGSIILGMLFGSENHRELYSLIRNCRHLASELPRGVIAIGDDGGGAKICLNLKAGSSGQILYWDNRPGRDDIYPIAETFTDLLCRLYVLE